MFGRVYDVYIVDLYNACIMSEFGNEIDNINIRIQLGAS
jgi:hypothetical protein